jgi:hypothetical protein
MEMTKTATKTAKTTTAKPAKAKVDKDLIVASTAIGDGEKHLVKNGAGKELIIPTARWAGDIRKASAVGQSFAALEKLWAEANVVKLAKGVDSRAAPHSAKAVADNAAKRKGAAKAQPAKADKAKAQPKAKKQNPVSSAHDRTYKVVNTDHGSRPGSKRDLQLQIVFAHTSTAAARAKGAESCDFRYASDKGFIKFV